MVPRPNYVHLSQFLSPFYFISQSYIVDIVDNVADVLFLYLNTNSLLAHYYNLGPIDHWIDRVRLQSIQMKIKNT